MEEWDISQFFADDEMEMLEEFDRELGAAVEVDFESESE